MKKLVSRSVSLVFALYPALALGAVTAPSDFKGLVNIFLNIIQILVVFVFSLTFLAILWGLIKGWIIHGGDTEGIESGKKVVSVGIVVLVIMSSIWGILFLLKSSFFGS